MDLPAISPDVLAHLDPVLQGHPGSRVTTDSAVGDRRTALMKSDLQDQSRMRIQLGWIQPE